MKRYFLQPAGGARYEVSERLFAAAEVRNGFAPEYKDSHWAKTGGFANDQITGTIEESPDHPLGYFDAAGKNPTPAHQQARIDKLERCLDFFASVIKSGEPWTAECERMYQEAKQC